MESTQGYRIRAAAERYTANLAKVSARLRELADRVDREGKVRERPYQLSHSVSAQQVLHEVTWGVANLGLENLLASASDADVAHFGLDEQQ